MYHSNTAKIKTEKQIQLKSSLIYVQTLKNASIIKVVAVADQLTNRSFCPLVARAPCNVCKLATPL